MNMNPLISIIVPVYNVEPYIRKCLDSILSQTYTNWEAILVDDGSTDQSGAICDEYAKKDARFVVVHKQNEGVAKARITAFEHSKGELITFIDSDDYVSRSIWRNFLNRYWRKMQIWYLVIIVLWQELVRYMSQEQN